MTEQLGLSVTVDRLENGKAVIRTYDGQELIIDLALLPTGSREGARLGLNFSNNQAGTVAQEQLAKILLKQILGKKNNVAD
ncbi:MAG: DUF3006 domain-containing protein [Patescibacteria group bacterium]